MYFTQTENDTTVLSALSIYRMLDYFDREFPSYGAVTRTTESPKCPMRDGEEYKDCMEDALYEKEEYLKDMNYTTLQYFLIKEMECDG